MALILHGNPPYCPRAAEDCALAPQRLAAVCHELGQHLHAFGLHAATLNLALMPGEAHEPLEQMSRSVQALENTIKTLHELVNLAAKNHVPVLRPIQARQVFRQLQDHFLPTGITIACRNDRPQVLSDPGVLFRLLRSALRSALRHSGLNTCSIMANARKDQVIFRIVAPPRNTSPRHYRLSTDDLDLEIAQILSHQIGHSLDISFDGEDAMHFAITAPRATHWAARAPYAQSATPFQEPPAP